MSLPPASKREPAANEGLAVRGVAFWLHRYVGLVMAVLLGIAGLTGTVLAFFEELDVALNPSLIRARPAAEPI